LSMKIATDARPQAARAEELRARLLRVQSP
jgi:hypothetical protein